jgi:hypothetical protein
VNNYTITDLNPGLFCFSSWLPENFSDPDSYREGEGAACPAGKDKGQSLKDKVVDCH